MSAARRHRTRMSDSCDTLHHVMHAVASVMRRPGCPVGSLQRPRTSPLLGRARRRRRSIVRGHGGHGRAGRRPDRRHGHHRHPIRTASRDAQAWFDQGMTLVFGFNHEEAVRSFGRAAELDPKAAMPHWGIAWALGPNYNLDIDDPRVAAGDRRHAAGAGAGGQRPGDRARLHRGDGRSATRPIPRPTAPRSRAVLRRDARRYRGAIPTTSTPRRSTPRA